MFLAPHIPVKQSGTENFFVPSRNQTRCIRVDREIVSAVSASRGFGIVEASFCGGKAPNFFKRSAYETKTFLLISSFEGAVLNVDGLARPHFKETEVWIGADGLSPLYMSGEWSNPNKEQLFALTEGQKIFFGDANREVSSITAQTCGDPPKIARASDSEVCTYLLEHARTVGKNNRRTRAWCGYAIRELGVQKFIGEFSKLFPDFSYRVR